MHNAQTAFQPATDERQAPLPLRSDTLLGICEGLGEEFGFNPLWLRVAFAAGLLWNAAAMVGAYLVLGVALAAARLIFPRPRSAAAQATAPVQEPSPSERVGETVVEERELIAA